MYKNTSSCICGKNNLFDTSQNHLLFRSSQILRNSLMQAYLMPHNLCGIISYVPFIFCGILKCFGPFTEMMTCVSHWKVQRKNCEIRSLKKVHSNKKFLGIKCKHTKLIHSSKILYAIYLAGGGHVKTEFDIFQKGESDVDDNFRRRLSQFLNFLNTNSFQHSSSNVNLSCFKQIACLGRLKE